MYEEKTNWLGGVILLIVVILLTWFFINPVEKKSQGRDCFDTGRGLECY